MASAFDIFEGRIEPYPSGAREVHTRTANGKAGRRATDEPKGRINPTRGARKGRSTLVGLPFVINAKAEVAIDSLNNRSFGFRHFMGFSSILHTIHTSARVPDSHEPL